MTEKNKHIEDKTIRHYGEEALREEAEAILDQIALLDDNFEKAVDLMYHCEGKIIVTGVGKSGHVGAKIAATLASTGTPAFYINPLDVYHGDLGVMTDKDVVLALSNSGQTDELLRFIPMVLHERTYHLDDRQSSIAVGKILQLPHHGEGEKGSLPAQPRSYKQHHSRTCHGRRLSHCADAGTPLQTTRLCTVPPWWRVGQAPAHHSRGRDEEGRPAYHS